MRLAFLDGASPGPYDAESLRTGGSRIGGAESTLARVALALSKWHEVAVVQTIRTEDHAASGGIPWLSLHAGRSTLKAAEFVVVQRRVVDALRVRLLNRHCRLAVWYHDWYDGHPTSLRARFKNESRALLHVLTQAEVIAVSNTHMQQLCLALQNTLAWRVFSRLTPRARFIYNPLSEDITSQARPGDYDPNKLLYFSAPWKGIATVVENFQFVKRKIPGIKLYIASPGYDPASGHDDPDIINLGTLHHRDLTQHIANAMCVFYPANEVPETFGLVFVESHALGTPVLAHPFGSAPEMLTQDELVDAKDQQGVFHKIALWRSGHRPVVNINPACTMQAVVEEWKQMLTAS
jgi:glycosyltransferase involved in cell wall biosynthesis